MLTKLAAVAAGTIAALAVATPAHAADTSPGVVTHAEYNTFKVWDTARTLTAKFGTPGATFLHGPVISWRAYTTDVPGTHLIVEFKRYGGRLHAENSSWYTVPPTP